MVALLVATLAFQDSAWVGKVRTFGATDDQYVYKVDQDNVVLDFKGGTIASGKPLNPDQSGFTGTGILIKGRKNVTIRNLKICGYRINFKVEDSENIRLENCTSGASRSIPIRTNGQDKNTFLDIRNIDVWRTYGAGFWVENSKNVVVKKSTAKGSQNGIILVSTTNSTIIENDFSFNSGWGIALGKSSENTICWNRADFVNRPWAGFWGGDSAALAVADSSFRNYIVGNSLTHSGDGFFLTHREENFDEQAKKIELKGASNDNVIAYNDGSWSTANAFEGTFSTGNVYFKNRANDSSAAGFWLGYSDSSLVLENEVLRNGNNGIAIEHGRLNLLEKNRIEDSKWSGIGLWASEDWKATAKPSERSDCIGNLLKGNASDYKTTGSQSLCLNDKIKGMELGNSPPPGPPNVLDAKTKFERDQLPRIQEILAMKPKGFKFYREEGGPKGIVWIQADDFAPRNFAGELAVWRQPDPGSLELYLTQDGVRVAAPDFVQFHPTPEDPRLVRISVRKNENEPGEERLIGVGVSSIAGSKKQLVKAILRTHTWSVKWFDWSGITYEDSAAWEKLFSGDALATQATRLLGGDFTGKSPAPGVPNHHFACLATTKLKLEAGRYIFSTTSDDGIRLFVDGQELISRWNHHGPTPDEEAITLSEGIHEIKVQYCQEAGSAILKVDWRRSD